MAGVYRTTSIENVSGVWRGDGQGARALPHEVRRRLRDVSVALGVGGKIVVIASGAADGKSSILSEERLQLLHPQGGRQDRKTS